MRWPALRARRADPPPETPETPTARLSARLDADLGGGRVEIALTAPEPAGGARFGFHAGRRVLALSGRSVHVSDDLGESWEQVQVEIPKDVALGHAFIRADGGILLQGLRGDDPENPSASEAPVYVCDADLNVVEASIPGTTRWHGTRSIDEAAGTIVFGEYPRNRHRGRGLPAQPELCQDSHLFRSADGGRTWETVHAVSWRDARHIHTVAADPFAPGTWWASTGDWPPECLVLRSTDDGRTWEDVTGEALDVPPTAAWAPTAQALYRYTDVAITPELMVWGTDDFLPKPGGVTDTSVPLRDRAGSRVCVARKGDRVDAAVVGYVGSPVRSIVDVGPHWLVTTQAKRPELPGPEVALVGKAPPHHVQVVGRVERHAGPTGFTASSASRAAVDGILFSRRNSGDAVPEGPRILRWEVGFG